MRPQARRMETRIPTTVTVELSSLHEPPIKETTSTENLSSRGARVLTTRPWNRNARVLVKSVRGDLRSRARVVYCESLRTSGFALGLELFAQAAKPVTHRSVKSSKPLK